MRRSIPILICALAALGCENHPASPALKVVPTAPQVAPPSVNTHSRANMVWNDLVSVNGVLVASSIRGDGRNRFGQAGAPANEYQSDFCGVRGLIYDGKNESGALDFDPDTFYDPATMSVRCGAARSLALFLAGTGNAATIATPNVKVSGLWSMTPGAISQQTAIVGMQQVVPCRFEVNAAYSGASSVRVTRLPDGSDATGAIVRRWHIESQGNHVAACLTPTVSDRYVDSGKRYYLPFAATLTQVRYTGETYP